MPARMRLQALLVTLTGLLLLLTAGAHAQIVTATVEAPWQETPLLQEGCEWAGRTLGDQLFFRCLNDVWTHQHGDTSTPAKSCRDMTQKEQYDVLEAVLATWVAEGLLSASRRELFVMEMASRLFSPAVEAHYVLATDAFRRLDAAAAAPCDAGAFVVVRGGPHTPPVMLQQTNLFTKTLERVAVHQAQGEADGGPLNDSLYVLQAPIPELDHEMPRASQSPVAAQPVHVFLYGLVGDAKTHAWLELLEKARTTTPSLIFSFRHLPASVARLCGDDSADSDRKADVQASTRATQQSVWARPLHVQGYGATLDFKNMEYKVVDEKNAQKADVSETPNAGLASPVAAEPALDAAMRRVLDQQTTVGGIDLAHLKMRYPELSLQLDAFGSDVDRILGSEAPKVSFDLLELQNLGLATVTFIADRNSSDRLSVLADVAARFPFHASRLSKMAANPARLTVVKQELESMQKILRSGVTAVVLDGELLPTAELSLFSVLKVLQQKEARFDALRTVLLLRHGEMVAGEWQTARQAQLPSPAVWDTVLSSLVSSRFRDDALQAARGDTSGAATRVALLSDAVLWLNNIETDHRFATLPHHLTALTQGGQLMLPRRNLLNIVVVLDPKRTESVMALFRLLETLRDGLPVRIGVVIVDPDSTGHFESHLDLDKRKTEGSSVASPFVLTVGAALFQLCRREEAPVEVIGRFLSLMAQSRFSWMGKQPHGAEDTLEEYVRDPDAQFFKQITRVALEDVVRDRDFQQFFHHTQEAVRSFGLLPDGRSHVTLMNGRIVSDLNSALDEEVAFLAQLVREGRLHDDDLDDVDDHSSHNGGLYDAILRAGQASRHFQPALEATRTTALSLHRADEVTFLQDFPFVSAASHAGEVALVSQVVLLPCENATLADWATAAQAVHVLAHCNTETGLEDSACHRTRLTLVRSCLSSSDANDKHEGSGALLVQLQGLLGAVQSMREAERARVICDYMEAVSLACAGFPRDMALTDGNVVGRVGTIQWPEAVAKMLSKVKKASAVAATHESLRLGFVSALTAALTAQTAPSLHTVAAESLRLLVNGRLVTLDESFVADDFVTASQLALPLARFALTTLEQLSLNELAPSSTDGFSADELDADLYSGKTAALASYLAASGADGGDVLLSRLRRHSHASHVAFEHVRTGVTSVPARHQLVAVVDPTDRESQVLIALCHYLAQAPLAVNITVFLNPPVEVQRPVRDVFTYVAASSLQFDSASGSVVPPRAVFRGLPTEQLLTLGIVEPQSWLVMPHRAHDDLDNIMLGKLPKERPVLSAVYRIHSLLVSGTAGFGRAESYAAAAGLPLSLRPVSGLMSKPATNTLVMENSGYYQLQATAGVWELAIQPGPMAAAFIVEAAEKEEGVGGDTQRQLHSRAQEARRFAASQDTALIVVDSFANELLMATVANRADSAAGAAPVAGGPMRVSAIAAAMASETRTQWPPVSAGDPAARPERPTLNIFSVASGHLYERFLRMMMYSVFRSSSDNHGANTTRIKFWVIENYLSPRFKAYIPKLAAHYGFEVGFVTYQWPWWLPKQTEKQRKIWAYKILFLDVIFPLEVDRIVFVDADQTARADLHELYHMNIEGAPVAMTPFCVENMNNATKGFRFWTEGFWKKQLAGRPYHISAIFLIDLQRFRAMRAGDTYRRTYSSLVADPNSLANLDQDLPNLLQDRVPIYSLPEEWLWCETWCSAESKARARTIDLCNNPLTKMPKLENAKLIVPDWETTDNMLESLAQKLMSEGIQTIGLSEQKKEEGSG